jgi:hypothetical protein
MEYKLENKCRFIPSHNDNPKPSLLPNRSPNPCSPYIQHPTNANNPIYATFSSHLSMKTNSNNSQCNFEIFAWLDALTNVFLTGVVIFLTHKMVGSSQLQR